MLLLHNVWISILMPCESLIFVLFWNLDYLRLFARMYSQLTWLAYGTKWQMYKWWVSHPLPTTNTTHTHAHTHMGVSTTSKYMCRPHTTIFRLSQKWSLLFTLGDKPDINFLLWHQSTGQSVCQKIAWKLKTLKKDIRSEGQSSPKLIGTFEILTWKGGF